MAGEFFQFAFLAAFAQPLALGVDVALQFGELLQLPLAFQQLSPALPQALALPFEALRGLGAVLFQAGFLFPQQPYLLLQASRRRRSSMAAWQARNSRCSSASRQSR